MGPPAPAASEGGLPRLAVVVPLFNVARVLPEAVPAMAAQDLAAEWLFVDDGSTDASGDVLARLLASHPMAAAGASARILRHPANRGRAAARQTGLDAATGDVVVFLDADMEPRADFLRAHARMYARPEVVGAVSPERWAGLDPREPYHVYLARYRRGTRAAAPGHPLSFRLFIIGYTSVRADVLRAAGGFDPQMPYGEDLDLAYRLYRRHPRGLWLAEDAVVLQHGAPRLGAALAKWRRFGRFSLPALLGKHPALAATLGADVVRGRGLRRIAGETVLRPAVARWLRRLTPRLPLSVQPFAVRALVAAAIAEGYREALRAGWSGSVGRSGRGERGAGRALNEGLR